MRMSSSRSSADQRDARRRQSSGLLEPLLLPTPFVVCFADSRPMASRICASVDDPALPAMSEMRRTNRSRHSG